MNMRKHMFMTSKSWAILRRWRDSRVKLPRLGDLSRSILQVPRKLGGNEMGWDNFLIRFPKIGNPPTVPLEPGTARMIKSTELREINFKQFRDSLTAQPVNSFPKSVVERFGLRPPRSNPIQTTRRGCCCGPRKKREKETQDAESGAQRFEERTLGERSIYRPGFKEALFSKAERKYCLHAEISFSCYN